jgi:hypothetical protein
MHVSQMVKEFSQPIEFNKCSAARMATEPLTMPARTEMSKDKCLPLAHVGVLLKSIFRFSVFVTQTLGTKAGPDEVVTEMGGVTLQRQRVHTSISLQMFSGMSSPGHWAVGPLEAQETEFPSTTIFLGSGLLAAVHMHPPRDWITPVLEVSGSIEVGLRSGDYVPIASSLTTVIFIQRAVQAFAVRLRLFGLEEPHQVVHDLHANLIPETAIVEQILRQELAFRHQLPDLQKVRFVLKSLRRAGILLVMRV